MKKLLALVLCLVMVFSLCACGARGQQAAPAPAAPAEGEEAAPAPAETYELIIGHVYTEDSLEHAQMLKIEEVAEAKAGGALDVVIFANEQLGDEQNIAEQVVTGACDVGFSEGSVWATVVNDNKLSVFGLPFQYSGPDAAKKVTEELIRPEMNKLCEGTGIYCLGNVYSGFRHVLTVDKPILSLDDLKGLKMRVPNATVYVSMFECMGCNPTTTAFSETYQALQQGVVEGAECDLANIVQQNWHEVNNYMSYTYHLAAMNVIMINADKWASFPAEIQTAIQDAVIESEQYCFELRATADAEYLGAIEAAGVEITTLDDAVLADMRASCQPIYDEFIGYGMSDLLDAIAAA